MDSISTTPTPLSQRLGLQFFHYLLINNNVSLIRFKVHLKDVKNLPTSLLFTLSS